MAVNDDIADRLISHQVGLQRLSNATVRKIIAQLNRSDARIMERLLRDDLTSLSRARQEALLRDIKGIVASVYEDATGALQIDLNALATYEVDYQADMFKATVPVELNFVRPSPDQIIAATINNPFQGKLMKEWYSELESGAFRRMRDSIRAGIIEGRTNAEIVRELRGTAAQGFKDGILQINRRAAEVTVRTATAHTASVARNSLYSRNGKFIKGLKTSATLDGRTSVKCRACDGSVIIGDGYKRSDFPADTLFIADIASFTNASRAPHHPNCRTSEVPILRSLKEMGIKGGELPASTRASMDGQVPADLTYDGWLRKQPVAYQDDILGRSKGKLFRAGLKMDRFVSRAGDELTLDELRTKEADIWAAAKINA